MKVNELIKLLQESVEENPEVGEYDVYMNVDYDEAYAQIKSMYMHKGFVDLESE